MSRERDVEEDLDLTVRGRDDLRRQICDALDLAFAAGAPWPVLEKLGAASGLLDALAEVPQHALVGGVVIRARQALRLWGEWQKRRGRKSAAA